MDIFHVTEVLNKYADLENVPQALLEGGQYRGKITHNACATIALGLWCPPVAPEYQGYVDSYIGWKVKFVKKVILVETTLFDEEMGISGTPDQIVIMIDDVMTLPDLKTPLSKGKTWPIQIAVYKHLARKNGYPVERVGSLRLHPEGKPATFDPYNDSAYDFAAFHAALIAHRYFYEGKKEKTYG